MNRFALTQQSRERVLVLTFALLSCFVTEIQAWGSSSSGTQDQSLYGNTFENDWLYDSSLSFRVEGCAWGYVEDSEEVGCLEDESDEGTTNWYMMANCRRPQVVFSVYKGNSCSSGNFVGSYITKSGVSEFLYYASTYDANYAYDDDSYSADNLANCESSNYGYVGLGCTDSGNFALNYYNDQYCISRTGNTYDSLNRLNKVIGTYESCKTSYKYGDDKDYSLIHQLVYNSEPCMAQDYGYCSNSKEYIDRSSTSSYSNLKTSKWSSKGSFGAHKSWVTKLKYVIGGLFLLASFIMFTGILFTNRRRRRAMMMRKYRQAKRQKREKKKSRSSSRRRSKSKTKDKGEGGFLT